MSQIIDHFPALLAPQCRPNLHKSMGFSGTIKLADLNDFIAPSQACVLNLDGKAKQDNTAAPTVRKPSTPSTRQSHCIRWAK